MPIRRQHVVDRDDERFRARGRRCASDPGEAGHQGQVLLGPSTGLDKSPGPPLHPVGSGQEARASPGQVA